LATQNPIELEGTFPLSEGEKNIELIIGRRFKKRGLLEQGRGQ